MKFARFRSRQHRVHDACANRAVFGGQIRR
jgi:hypothetical protein